MVIDCQRGFGSLLAAAQRAYISNIHFVLSRKAWDDQDRRDQNLKALNNASEFLHKVQDHANEFVVVDRDTRDSLTVCRDAMTSLNWLKGPEAFTPFFGIQVEECRDIVDEFRDRLVQKYTGANPEILVEDEKLQKPAELFSKIYDQLTTEMLSQRQGCW